jgi:hypothetical protein
MPAGASCREFDLQIVSVSRHQQQQARDTYFGTDRE